MQRALKAWCEEGLCHKRADHPRVVQLRGYGMSADAHHITQPPPDGAGAARAMERALDNAGAAPEQVMYVNAHGTGTPLGDAAELAAIQKVFGSAGMHREQREKHKVLFLPWPLDMLYVPCPTDKRLAL